MNDGPFLFIAMLIACTVVTIWCLWAESIEDSKGE